MDDQSQNVAMKWYEYRGAEVVIVLKRSGASHSVTEQAPALKSEAS